MADLWTMAEIREATGGRCSGDPRITGLSIDSREISRGDLFVALDGERFDGHDFVADALEAGASAALVHKAGIGGDVPEDRLIVVDDTQAALHALGQAARTRCNAKIVAVTGSVGKTGTKEALLHVFADQGAAHASVRSFNNDIGVPVSLARMPRETEFAVFELGMNHPGELGPLSRQVRPQIALITTVEFTHAAHFDSAEGIARAKAEIFEGLPPKGVAVLNRDNEWFDFLSAAAAERGIGDIVSFGLGEEADARGLKFCLKPQATSVMAEIFGVPIAYKIGMPGEHWVRNSLAVLAVARLAGADLGIAGLSLARMRPLPGRGAEHRIPTAGGDITIVDESYNASPASMTAAIATLGRYEPEGEGRRVAVLGDMLELGPQSGEMHRALAAPLEQVGVTRVYTIGEEMKRLHDALPRTHRAGHAENLDDLSAMVIRNLQPGDVVMVKGSNAIGLARLVEALRALADNDRPKAVNG